MLEGRTYVPLLHARLAEMRALRELPTATKNLILPIVRIRPWLNSKRLVNAFDVITDSFGDRAFGVDLDTFRNNPTDERAAYQDFAKLFNPFAGYAAYYDCIEEANNRIPVIRRDGGQTLHLMEQLARINTIDHGLFVRVMTNNPGDFLDVAQACLEQAVSNVVFAFDCGWRVDVLGQAAMCAGLANSLLDVTEEFELVIAGSSFPASFTGLGERFEIDVSERLLYAQVRQSINRGRIYYGDWGSTRPPTPPVPMTNIPRIDIASALNWICWRSEAGESYADIAERVVEDEDWEGNTGLWGDYMISSTADGLDPCIRSPAMAAAVRVNLHMHMQAHFDNPNNLAIEDERVGDDL